MLDESYQILYTRFGVNWINIHSTCVYLEYSDHFLYLKFQNVFSFSCSFHVNTIINIHYHSIKSGFLFRCLRFLIFQISIQNIYFLFLFKQDIVLVLTLFQHFFELFFKLSKLILQFLYLCFFWFKGFSHFCCSKTKNMFSFL